MGERPAPPPEDKSIRTEPGEPNLDWLKGATSRRSKLRRAEEGERVTWTPGMLGAINTTEPGRYPHLDNPDTRYDKKTTS